MKVSFRCLRSNNVVTFSNEADIESMRKDRAYEEIKETPSAVPTEQPDQNTKPRGRPRKGN